MFIHGDSWGLVEETGNNSVAEPLEETFLGRVSMKMDNARRIAFPSDFKHVLDTQFPLNPAVLYVMAFNNRLRVMPCEVWKKKQAEIKAVPSMDLDADDLLTAIFGDSAKCKLDSQNRIQIPAELCEELALEKEVLLVGKSDYVEVWNPTTYRNMRVQLAGNYRQVVSNVFKS